MSLRVVRDQGDDPDASWLDLPVERWPDDPLEYPDADHWPDWTDIEITAVPPDDPTDDHDSED